MGSEIIASKSKVEETQNNFLMLVCWAVKKIPVAALQLYTHYLPIITEIQQPRIAHINLQALQYTNWIKKKLQIQTLKLKKYIELERSTMTTVV